MAETHRFRSAFLVLLFLGACRGHQNVPEGVPPELEPLYNSDLDQWKAPEDYRQKYPYYLSGYDEEGHPIWVVEFGKWDMRSVLEEGKDAKATFDKYVNQGVLTIYNSSITKDGVNPVIGIMDMEGYTLKQLNSPKTVEYIIEKLRLIVIALRNLHSAYFLNTNFFAERILHLVRPLLGKEFEKFEIHGTNKARWKTKVLKTIPRDQLPSWYGGSEDFKPVMVYG